MSIFTSRITRVLSEIPGATGESVTIRKLNPKQLQRAAKAAQAEALSNLSAFANGEVVQKVMEAYRASKEAELAAAPVPSDEERQAAESPAAVVEDPLNAYDRVELMASGVVAWTLMFEPADAKPAPISRETVEDLDDQAQDFLAREVQRLAKPELFRTNDESAAARKNG